MRFRLNPNALGFRPGGHSVHLGTHTDSQVRGGCYRVNPVRANMKQEEGDHAGSESLTGSPAVVLALEVHAAVVSSSL